MKVFNFILFNFLLLIGLFVNQPAYSARAMLPLVSEVPPAQSMPIDGVWLIEIINKKVVIDKGRVYAKDPWVHAFIWQIEPDMVVQKDLKRVHAGIYQGYDLPLLGNFDATLQKDGKLDYKVKGALGPARFILSPVELKNHSLFDRELSSINQVENPNPIKPNPPNKPPVKIIRPPKFSEGAPFPYPVSNDFTPGCGGEGQPLCNKKPAFKVSKAQKLGCPGKNSHFSPRNGGECWSCPSGYKRTAQFINGKKACAKKFVTGPYSRAKYQRSVWGCPKGQFHTLKDGGSCWSCPKGYKRISVAGVDSYMCDIPNKYQCDGPLKVAKLPPFENPLANLLGSKKVKVCGINKSIAKQAGKDLKNMAEIYYYADQLHKDLTRGTVAAKMIYNGLLRKKWPKVMDTIKTLDSYKNLLRVAQESENKTITVGLAGDIQAIIGSNIEFGIAINTDGSGGFKPYRTAGFTKGVAIGADLGITVGLWRAPSHRIDGPAQGIAASLGGTYSGGAGVWYSYYSPGTRGQEYLGFTITGGAGLGLEVGEYNEVWTEYL